MQPAALGCTVILQRTVLRMNTNPTLLMLSYQHATKQKLSKAENADVIRCYTSGKSSPDSPV